MHRVKYKTDDLPKPGLELLVHNISHADMLVALREMPLDEDGSREGTRTFLARPQFNSFMPVSKAIEDHLEKLETGGVKPGVISCISTYGVHYPTGLDLEVGDSSSGVELKPSPRLQRLQNFLSGGASSGSPVGDEADSGDDGSKPSSKPGTKAATAWSLFHLKGDKDGKTPMGRELAVRQSSAPRVIAVYLPLLAVVLPEWIRSINRRMQQMADGTPSPRKVLVLVSGAGQPRDVKANPADNSTEGTGHLIERFLRIVHPDIEVVHITSAYGIFRYDDNVRFVKEQVLPIIESKRTDVVADHHEHWTRHLKVTVCLADGAPARISALNAACRSYRPDYLHVWRTKTFWDTQTLCEEDVESHTFKKLEMRPATHRSQLADFEKGIVEEMVRYKRQFEAVRDSSEHELGSFWLRKTGKAVLAVLATRKADGTVTFWRGMNVEVSMPTGTLCAERNAIGNALAADQSLERSHMQMVAVLSVSLDPKHEHRHDTTATSGKLISASEMAEIAMNPLDPCGACMEWLRKISEVNPDFKVLTFTSTNCEKIFITPIGDYG